MCPFPHAMSHSPSCPPEFWFIWAHLLTYPLGARFLPLAPRGCSHRVRSTVRVPNRHCALFTLICLTQKRYVTNQCASWGVTHCPPSMELYPGDTLVACNYTGEANDIKRLSGGYSGIRRELYALAFEEPWYSIYIYPRRQFAYPSLPQDLVTWRMVNDVCLQQTKRPTFGLRHIDWWIDRQLQLQLQLQVPLHYTTTTTTSTNVLRYITQH